MKRQACGLTLCLALIVLPRFSQAFYERQDPDSSLEIHGFIGLGGGQLTYPADNNLYGRSDDHPWSAALRLLGEAGRGDDLHLTANILQSTRSLPPLSAAMATPLPSDVERSGALTWEQHYSASSRSELLVDALHLQYRMNRVDIAVGRQSVNLATTFYFAPNDFFAPFAAQTFFRVYKPGVDAVRVDTRLAELSQFTMLAVLAYDPDHATGNGWSRGPDWSRTSLLARMSMEMAGFEWMALAGEIDDYLISGGSLQGDLLGLVGLRAEGHYGEPRTAAGSSFYKLAVGIEKLYANSFNWRLEYFQNSNAVAGLSSGRYRNRDYAALGGGYEFTPLLTGSGLLLTDINDDSLVFSVNLLYSLSNEADLSLIVSLPFGDEPTFTELGSEFGSQPRMALLEYRQYF